jgi:hypothetical protein
MPAELSKLFSNIHADARERANERAREREMRDLQDKIAGTFANYFH